MEKTRSLGDAHQSVENLQVPKCPIAEGPPSCSGLKEPLTPCTHQVGAKPVWCVDKQSCYIPSLAGCALSPAGKWELSSDLFTSGFLSSNHYPLLEVLEKAAQLFLNTTGSGEF